MRLHDDGKASPSANRSQILAIRCDQFFINLTININLYLEIKRIIGFELFTLYDEAVNEERFIKFLTELHKLNQG